MIHINIGSNLNSNFGSKIDNITVAIKLLIESKIKITKISKVYETPSYPNQNFPKFLNVGIRVNSNNDCLELLKVINLIEKKIEDSEIIYITKSHFEKKTIPNFLIDKSEKIEDLKSLLEGLRIVGDYLEKSILRPNNMNFPISRVNFVNTLK